MADSLKGKPMLKRFSIIYDTWPMKVLLVVLGAAILIARNSDPLLNPALYTEDGYWSGLLYSFGPLAAYLHARPDYLVIGNIALLHLAALLNDLFTSDSVDQLPVWIAVVSYAFYAFCAVFVATAFRPYLSCWWRLVCWLAVLLLPMGTHMNEVLGRLSNAGYAFYVLATMGVLLRLRTRTETFSRRLLPLDALLLLCALTNPLCAPLLVGACVIDVVIWRRPWSAATLSIAIVTAAATWAFYLGSRLPQPEAEVDFTGFFSALVPFLVARPLVYPFAFPFYHSLTDLRTIIAATVVATYLVWGWWSSSRRLEFGYLLFALALVTLATAFARPGLYVWLVDYKLSFPDRYFYAQNVLVLLAFIWATSELANRYRRWSVVPFGTFGVVGAIWIYGAGMLFDPILPALTVRTGSGFAEQLSVAAPAENHPGILSVKIYPEGWTAFFPEELRPGR